MLQQCNKHLAEQKAQLTVPPKSSVIGAVGTSAGISAADVAQVSSLSHTHISWTFIVVLFPLHFLFLWLSVEGGAVVACAVRATFRRVVGSQRRALAGLRARGKWDAH